MSAARSVLGGDMRTFDMNTGDHRGDVRMLSASLADCSQGCDEAGLRRGDERRQESRDADLEHRLAKGLHGRDVERQPIKIMSSIAINLQVNEARAEPLVLTMLQEINRLDQLAFSRNRDAPARRGIAAKDALGRDGGHGSARKFRSSGHVDIQRAVGVLLDDRSGTSRSHRTFDGALDGGGLTLVGYGKDEARALHDLADGHRDGLLRHVVEGRKPTFAELLLATGVIEVHHDVRDFGREVGGRVVERKVRILADAGEAEVDRTGGDAVVQALEFGGQILGVAVDRDELRPGGKLTDETFAQILPEARAVRF